MSTEEHQSGLVLIKKGAQFILEGLANYIGIDPTDDNFKDTADRVMRSYAEIFDGGHDTETQIADILKTGFPGEDYDEMITCKDIKTFSMCPHHLLPVEYNITLSYIPGAAGKVLGVSKLVRIAQVLSKRPVLQEALTKDIGKTLERIGTGGVGVRVEGVHFCMRMRGVKSLGSVVTSYLSGAYKNADTRAEFFNGLN